MINETNRTILELFLLLFCVHDLFTELHFSSGLSVLFGFKVKRLWAMHLHVPIKSSTSKSSRLHVHLSWRWIHWFRAGRECCQRLQRYFYSLNTSSRTLDIFHSSLRPSTVIISSLFLHLYHRCQQCFDCYGQQGAGHVLSVCVARTVVPPSPNHFTGLCNERRTSA